MLLSDVWLVSKAQRGGIMAYSKHLRQCCLDGQPSNTVTVVMLSHNFSMREVIVNLDSLRRLCGFNVHRYIDDQVWLVVKLLMDAICEISC